jgi:hypothetical protein
MKLTYETQVKGIRIYPGSWRPHYIFEHIAWISPPWPSQDYIWIDFPEAIFTSNGIIYLSHVNPVLSTAYPNLTKVQWEKTSDGLRYKRILPNGIIFGGNLKVRNPFTVRMELYIFNGSQEPLRNITLQTCVFLRAIREFADFTLSNKFVHLPEKGWVSYPEAKKKKFVNGLYHLGWRSGPTLADLPFIVTLSNSAKRLLAMTWDTDTFSLVGNPNHPCMHADPFFPDLKPNEYKNIIGRLIFHEGSLSNFEEKIRNF